MASTIKVDTIDTPDGTGNITLNRPIAGDGSNLTGVGKIVQVVHTHEGGVATGTTIAPTDDTILQNTEGTEFMTLAITPTNASNKLLIDVIIYLTTSNPRWHITGLFQDSTANALAVCRFYGTSQTGGPSVIKHYMTAGTTSSTTFKVRSGPHSAETITLNGELGNRNFGGVFSSTMTITEIAV